MLFVVGTVVFSVGVSNENMGHTSANLITQTTTIYAILTELYMFDHQGIIVDIRTSNYTDNDIEYLKLLKEIDEKVVSNFLMAEKNWKIHQEEALQLVRDGQISKYIGASLIIGGILVFPIDRVLSRRK